jgi:hypothetical protein
MSPDELLAKYSIKLESTAPGRYYTTCPECSSKRKLANQSKKCLGVLIDERGACWHCNHCHWNGPEKGAGTGKADPIETAYNYIEDGEFRFQKVRYPKGHEPPFRIRTRGADGGWKWGAEGLRKPLYRIDEITAAIKDGRTILVVEGEKDVDNCWRLGFPATCNFDGAVDVIKYPNAKPKWKAEYSEALRDADIVILNDNDGPGYAHADVVCRLSHGLARRVRRLDLAPHWPNMPAKADVSDWLVAGHTKDELAALIAAAPDYAPQAEQDSQEAPPQQEAEAIDADAEIERLMQLSDFEYERQKRGAAKKLGVGVGYLDRLRKAMHTTKVDNRPGHAISFPTIEPWPEPVDGSALLTELAETIGNHIIMPAHCRDLCALWVVHSYIFHRFMISPKLWVRSIVKGSGKTTLLDVLKHLVCRPYTTESISKAALFRLIEDAHPTLLIDEVDRFIGEDQDKELIGLLNASHRYDGRVTRTVGDDFEVRGFSVYAAIALSGIGGLAATLADRSICIELQRRRASEEITPLRIGRTGHLDELCRRVVRWIADHEGRVADRDPILPQELFNRGGDNWVTILAIADEAGGGWPERARLAAMTANAYAAADDSASLIELLLRDIRDVFAEQPGDLMGEVTIGSANLVDDLIAKLGRPWAEMGRSRKPLTQNRLARMLGTLKPTIAPEQIRFGPQDTRKGYRLSHFRDAFNRLLGENWASQPKHRNKRDEMGTSGVSQPKPAAPEVSVAKCKKPNNGGLGFEVSVAKGQNGGIKGGGLSHGSREQLASLARARGLHPRPRPGRWHLARADRARSHRHHRDAVSMTAPSFGAVA